MKSNKFSRFFTLVEVLIALGISVFGICSIMALFPVSGSASREATMAGFAANAADQLLEYAKYRITTDADAAAVFKQFTICKGDADGWNIGTITDYVGNLKANEIAPGATENETGIASDIKTFFQASTTDDFKIYDCENNTYRIEYINGEETEFSCYLSMWPTPVKIVKDKTKNVSALIDSDTTGSDYSAEDFFVIPGAVRLNVEVSWPTNLEYAKRKKLVHSLEIFRMVN